MKRSLAYWKRHQFDTGFGDSLEFKRAVAEKRALSSEDKEDNVTKLLRKYGNK